MGKIGNRKLKILNRLKEKLDLKEEYLERIIANGGPNLYGDIWHELEARSARIESNDYDKVLLTEFIASQKEYAEI